MRTLMPTAITVSGLDCRLVDDTAIFSQLTATIPTGLIGDNGIDKSTLAKMLAGLLTASAGTITGAGHAVYIDQLLPQSQQRVDSALGIGEIRAALHRALAGEAGASEFALIGTDWD